MIAIDDNFKISENGGTGNATIFVSATDKNLFSTASTQVEVSTSVGGNIKRYVTLNKKAAHGYMYTPVEWVSNEDIDTRIWIDLGYVWKNNSRAQLGFVIPGSHQKPNGQQVFGEDTVWAADGNGPLDDTNDLRLFFAKYGSITNIGAYWDVATSRIQSSIGAITDVWQDWEIGNNYIKNLSNNTNFVTGSTYTISREGTVGLYGACQYLNTGRTDCVRYSYIKIYEGDTLVRDIIPVLDKDNIPCFFDKVGEQFYYYKVNGEPSTGLTAGSAMQELDYLQGDGSDYVVLDYIPSATTIAEIDVEGGKDTTNRYLFGGRNRSSSNQLLSSVAVNQFKEASFNFLRGTQTYNVSNNTTRELIRHTPDGGYINDTKVATFTEQTNTINAPFGLYHCMQYVNGTISIDTGLPNVGYNGKIYSFKVYEGETLVRDYVPAKVGSTRGFYDKVLGNFYPSNSNSLIDGNILGNLTVSVIYDESDITISNETPSTAINAGNTFNLNASTTPTGATLTYSSSDTSIATVDSNGVVTAVGKGTATITITAQAFQDNTNHIYYNTTSKTVTVECAYQSQQIVITNSTPSEAINPNDTFDLNASTTPTGITLTYSSSDTSVATVNSNGVITGVATGTTTITITAQGFDDDVNKVHYNTTSKTVSVEVQEATPPAWDADFLTIEAENAETTITLKNPSNKKIWYRKDNETEYTKIPTGDTSITIENANGYIKLYGDNEGVGTNSNTTAFNIYCQMNCNCYGKVTSLLSSGCPETISSTYTFSQLFSQSLIVDASGLILPNNVTGNCYNNMFMGCTSLVQAPQLLATTLKSFCYSQMFMGCTSLVQAPQLLATTLEDFCYYNMFLGCGKLSTVTLYYADTAPTDDSSSFAYWLEYAGGTGSIIYAPANALWDSSDSTMYIPSNWTVEKVLYTQFDITISNNTPSTAISVGNTFNLNASTTPTGATLTYSSSDTSIATVDSNGVITAVAEGTATITITAQGFDDDVNKVHYNTTSKTVRFGFNPLTDSGYFVVKALSNTKVAFAGNNTSPDLYYRINGASSWQNLYIGYSDPYYDGDGYYIALNEGDYAEIKGNITNDYGVNPSTTLNDIKLEFCCNTPNSIEIGGYLTALNQNEEINQTNNEVTVSYQYRYLFNSCTGLVSAQYLKLSDNTTNYCYQRLFYKCSNLVTPPQQIQVSNLAEDAFAHSFYACTSLTSVPVLSATHIGRQSYGAMFRKCTSLTTVSLLSPRTFDSEACRQMFMDCTNLTSLSVGFSEYDSSTQALYEILSNVTTTGTFYCPSNATYSASDLGLPSTWTLSKTL